MKKLFTLIIAIGLLNFAHATSSDYTMEEGDYQAIVDYSNDMGTNTSEYSSNTDNYYGASAYYGNYDFRDGKWDNVTFSTWQLAVKESVGMAVLPAKYPEASTDDTISVYFKVYDGVNTFVDYFTFVCTQAGPNPVFADFETQDGNYKANILSFSLAEQVAESEVDYSENTISIIVAPGTDVTALTPEISISENATIDPALDAAVDFSGAVTYTVTAENTAYSSTWTVNVSVMEASITPIADIQYVENPEINDSSAFVNQTVIIEGIVTGFSSGSSYNKIFIQDGDGDWDGIYVFDPNTGLVASLGDSVQITGNVSEYWGLTEIEATKMEIISSRNTVPDPVVVSGAITEPLEGVLATIQGVTISEDTSDDSKAFLIATKDGVEYKVYNELSDAVSFEANKEYNLVGVITYTYDNYRICPRGPEDVVVLQNSVENGIASVVNLKVYPNPTQDYLYVEGADFSDISISNIAGQKVDYVLAGVNKIDVSALSNGVYFIRSNNKATRFIKK